MVSHSTNICCIVLLLHRTCKRSVIPFTKAPNKATAGRQKDHGHGRGVGGAEHGSDVPGRVHWCHLPCMPSEARDRGSSSSCMFKFCILASWLKGFVPCKP